MRQVEGRKGDQRVGQGYSAEAVTEEILAGDSLLSGEQFLRDEGVFGSRSREKWERGGRACLRLGLMTNYCAE
jgi:hypothetical protein